MWSWIWVKKNIFEQVAPKVSSKTHFLVVKKKQKEAELLGRWLHPLKESEPPWASFKASVFFSIASIIIYTNNRLKMANNLFVINDSGAVQLLSVVALESCGDHLNGQLWGVSQGFRKQTWCWSRLSACCMLLSPSAVHCALGIFPIRWKQPALLH